MNASRTQLAQHRRHPDAPVSNTLYVQDSPMPTLELPGPERSRRSERLADKTASKILVRSLATTPNSSNEPLHAQPLIALSFRTCLKDRRGHAFPFLPTALTPPAFFLRLEWGPVTSPSVPFRTQRNLSGRQFLTMSMVPVILSALVHPFVHVVAIVPADLPVDAGFSQRGRAFNRLITPSAKPAPLAVHDRDACALRPTAFRRRPHHRMYELHLTEISNSSYLPEPIDVLEC